MNLLEDKEMVSIHLDSILDLLEGDFYGIVNYKRMLQFISDKPCDKSKHGKTNSTHRDIVDHALIGDGILLDDLEDKIRVLCKTTNRNNLDYNQKIVKSVRSRRFSDEGDEIDIDRVYSGDLDSCWIKTSRTDIDQSHKFVTLFIENGDNWNENVYSSFWRSAIAVFLTTELESAGKSVRIVVGSCTSGAMNSTNKMLTQSITIKEYNQRVSMERIAAMTHLGFFRSVGFAIFCMSPYKLTKGIGESTYMGANIWPIQLQDQINKGSTRLIHIQPASTKTEAIYALDSAYDQLLNASIS